MKRARGLLLIVLVGACPGPVKQEQTTIPTNSPEAIAADESSGHNYKAGPGGFPVPKDGSLLDMAGEAVNYEIPRTQAVVLPEVRTNIAALGFTVDRENAPGTTGTVRWLLSKGDQKYLVSLAGDGDRSLLIITVK